MVDAVLLADLRRDVRHLLHDLTGSTTRDPARDLLNEIIGRPALTIHLSPAELRVVKAELERRKVSKI